VGGGGQGGGDLGGQKFGAFESEDAGDEEVAGHLIRTGFGPWTVRGGREHYVQRPQALHGTGTERAALP